MGMQIHHLSIHKLFGLKFVVDSIDNFCCNHTTGVSQRQINRFHDKLSQLTQNDKISREAGRYSASPDAIGAMLIIEVDGMNDDIGEALKRVAAAADNDECIEINLAETPEAVEKLWKTRKSLSPALRHVAPKKINEDVAVPISSMPALIEGLERLSGEHDITIVNFGHAGNGNIHVNLLVNPDDAAEMQRAQSCLAEVFALVIALKGTLSGEHGVGLEKRDFISMEIDPVSLRLMHRIKQQFDPNNILNPGKTLPPI